MDKLIKTISESGSFRAYVLDSTKKRSELHKKNTIHYRHQQLLWGVPLLPIKSWLLTKRVIAKLQLRLSETALLVISSL